MGLVDEDYYWVPGTWVLPPEVGLRWTPPYWATPVLFFTMRQDLEHQHLGHLAANAARMQELEQRHQQQTMQLQQRRDIEVAKAADPTAVSNPGSAQASFTASLELCHRTAGLDFAC
jgi:predicted patatin/cPLA2 family phospholipase